MTDAVALSATFLFHIINVLIGVRHGNIDEISSVLHGVPHHSISSSSDYVSVYNISCIDKGLSNAEIRLPVKGGAEKLFLLNIDVENSDVTKEDITRILGNEFEVSIPTARQPINSPIYYKYSKVWGGLNFGIDAQDRIVSVVLDIQQ